MSAAYFENDALVKALQDQGVAIQAPKTVEEGLLQSYDEAPSRLDMAIGLFTRQATSDLVGSVHARSVRIPTIENATIEALAQFSGLSVNKVICSLLEVALDEVFQGLKDEPRAEIFRIRSAVLQRLDGSHAQAEPGEC